MFTIGGTDINIHKFLGAENPDEGKGTADQPTYDAVKETNIQDLLFLENRDRKYDPDVYSMRGIYNVQDIDFDLSQFGLFLSNDTLMWMIFSIQSIALGVSIYFGAFDYLLEHDITRLSFLTIGLWLIGSVMVGYGSNNSLTTFYDTPWFIADSAMAVGMVGTVLGFIMMLGSSFVNIDPGNIDSMRLVITEMAVGMSTALLTTLTGLVSSLFIKIQIMIQEHKNE